VKRLLLLITLLTLAIAVPLGVSAAPGSRSSSPAVSHTSTASYCADTEEQAFLTLINTYRSQNGLAPLLLSQSLGAAAYHHSSDMATNNYFSHTLADGTNWDTNIRNHGYGFATALAENIAAGNSTASATMTQWKNSAGHNANMLSASYTAIGIGRAYNANSQYGWYWTTTFGGVQDGAATLCSAGTATPTATPSPTATPAPSTKVFVSALTGSKATSKSSTTLTYTVTVKETTGRVVAGAQVTLVVTTPTGKSITLTGATSTKGVVKLTVKASDGKGSYQGRVTDIQVAGKPYDASRNAATSVTIAV
jgi:uncharacterized protein YkwD